MPPISSKYVSPKEIAEELKKFLEVIEKVLREDKGERAS
ncbi:hypothetical protein ES703_37509 [subsurface metagenome]